MTFAMLSGDYDEIHTNEDFCKRESVFKTRIAHGMLGLSLVEGLKKRIPVFAETRYIASLEWNWKFTGPIFLGDSLHVKIRINEMRESKSKPDRGIIVEGGRMINQRGEVVQEGEHSLMIWRRPK
jgi:acyl dehydratase